MLRLLTLLLATALTTPGAAAAAAIEVRIRVEANDVGDQDRVDAPDAAIPQAPGGFTAEFGNRITGHSVRFGTHVEENRGVSLRRQRANRGPSTMVASALRARTETVHLAMSRAELKAMQETGLVFGGRDARPAGDNAEKFDEGQDLLIQTALGALPVAGKYAKGLGNKGVWKGLGEVAKKAGDAVKGAVRRVASRALPRVAGHVDQFGMNIYKWAGGGSARFSESGGRVVVDYLKRGGAPSGSAGQMLAESLKAAGRARPTELFAPNVLQKAANSNAVMENTLSSAAQSLGGTVTGVARGVDAGKHWIRLTIGY